MAINLVSPGVKITEADLVKTIPPTSGSVGGTAGAFRWGPIEDPVLVTSEAELVANFGAPDSNTSAPYTLDFLNVTNFLSYSSGMRVVRAANTSASGAKNATAAGAGLLQKNDAAYEAWLTAGGGDASSPWLARHAGEMGNSLRVSTCPSANAWQSNLTGTFTVAAGGLVVTGSGSTANTQLSNGDIVVLSGRSIKVASVTNATSFTLAAAHPTGASAVTAIRRWEYFGSFDQTPGTSASAAAKGASGDEMHIVVVDEDGLFTGAPGTIVEKFASVSKGSDARGTDGGSNFYKDVINTRSKYIRWHGKESTGTNWDTVLRSSTGVPTAYTVVSTPKTYSLASGADGVPGDGEKQTAFLLFANKETVSIDVIPVGAASATVINTVIGDVAEVRKDIMVCFSPARANVVNNAGSEADAIETFSNSITRSTYAVMDSNWKYQYNKYSDSYIYVPCNADVAGCLARTDVEAAPWFSPAGYTRGNIKNAVKLAWNPKEVDRDQLYKLGINPVITQTGRGTILFGDKTFSSTVGSFSRINVRRLFIQLEKSIGGLANNLLFDQNDDATRAGFVDTVEPYLRSVQAQRGVTQFAVVCDASNNPEDVVNANGFVADIYVRPVSSINFIQLNFVSVAGAASFSTIGG